MLDVERWMFDVECSTARQDHFFQAKSPKKAGVSLINKDNLFGLLARFAQNIVTHEKEWFRIQGSRK